MSTLASTRTLYLLKSSPYVLGAQRHVIDLAEAFSPRFAATTIATNPVPFTDQLRATGATWARLPPRDGMVGLALTGLRLQSIVRSRRISLIHSHHRYLTTAAHLFVPDVPLIHTAHNVFTTRRHSTLLGRRLIAVSGAVRRNLIDYFGCHPDDVATIHNGIRPSLPSPQQRPLPDDATVTLVCPARLESPKGHLFLLQAIALLRDRDLHVRALLCGRGELEAELRVRTHALGLDDRVQFLGHRGDMADVYQRAQMMVLPSLQEGLPYSLLEASAAGTPCIATDVGGVSEIVRDRQTGLLVPPGDPVRLASAIRLLATAPALRAELGSCARSDVLERFSMQSMLELTAEQYAHAVGKRPVAFVSTRHADGVPA